MFRLSITTKKRERLSGWIDFDMPLGAWVDAPGDLPLFSLTNRLLRGVGEIIPDTTGMDVEEACKLSLKSVPEALKVFSSEILRLIFPGLPYGCDETQLDPAYMPLLRVGEKTHVEALYTDIPGVIPEAEPLLLGGEFYAIGLALALWLYPQGRGRAGGKDREMPSERYSFFFKKIPAEAMILPHIKNLIGLPHEERWYIFLYNVVKRRQLQFSCEVDAININRSTRRSGDNYRQIKEERVFTETYCSERGLLPLVWAEILHAVKNDIYARPCDICGQWFPLEKGKYNQKHCSAKCQSEAKRRLTQRQRKGG